MTKRQNTHISETEKVYCVIMTSFLTKTLEILHKDLSYVIFGPSKFGLVQMKGSRIKVCTISSERPVQLALQCMAHTSASTCASTSATHERPVQLPLQRMARFLAQVRSVDSF